MINKNNNNGEDLLFNFTLKSISERNLNGSSFSRDYYVEKAIRKYLAEENERERAEAFMESFQYLLQGYEKQELVKTFSDFIYNEIINEHLLENHQNHYIHSIQVFLFGYNIITNWSYLTRKYRRKRTSSLFSFKNFSFGWMIASLFHDEKYIEENAPDIMERLRDIILSFQSSPDVDASYNTLIREGELEKYARILFEDFTKLLNMGKQRGIRPLNLTYENFKEIFDIKVDKIVDHGFLSAIYYMKFLDKTQTQYRLNKIQELIEKYSYTSDLLQQCLNKEYLTDHYLELRNELEDIRLIIGEIRRIFLEWEVNKSAYLAIALHNFKQNKFENFDFNYFIRLSCSRKREIIPYLLIICDTIQQWDRILNVRIIEDNIELKLKKFKKNERIEGNRVVIFKRLTAISFNEKGANLTINHHFKNIIYENYLKSEFKLKLLAAYKNFLDLDFEKITNKLPVYVNILENNVNLPRNKKIERDNIEIEELTNFILEPFKNEKKYEIIVSHLLEGSPYATAYFYL